MMFKEFYEQFRHRPVYVVLGVQGSGTNLLSRILTRVFGFSVLRDRSMVFNAAARLGQNPSVADVAREIEAFRMLVAPTRLHRKMGRKYIQQSAPFDGIFAELSPTTIRTASDFFSTILAYRAFSLGAREMATKSDDLWENIRHIDEVIPNRRVILLTRDFRDNLLSVGGKGFGPVEPICAALYVKRQFQFYEAEYRRSGSRGYHATFETLVQSPREFVADLMRHFNLAPIVDPSEALATIPPRPNKVAKWKQLTPRQLAWCEAILEEELIRFGYAPASAHTTLPSTATIVAARARDMVKRFPQKTRRIVARLSR
jgi:hypothetical protein